MFAWTAPDRDDDGLPDRADDCPSEAEVRNGLEDWDGCPDDSTVGDLLRHPFRVHFAVGYGIGLSSYRESTPPVEGASMALVFRIFGFELGPAFVIGSTKDIDGNIPWSRGIHFALSPLTLGPWRNEARKRGFTFEPMIGLMSLWTTARGVRSCPDWMRPETCFIEPGETRNRMFFTGGVRIYFQGFANVVGLELRAVAGTNDALWLSFIVGGGVLS